MECQENVEFSVFVSKPHLTIKGYTKIIPKLLVKLYNTFTLHILPRRLEYAATALYLFVLTIKLNFQLKVLQFHRSLKTMFMMGMYVDLLNLH